MQSQEENLIYRCQAIIRIGTLMASAGTGAYRVKEVMNRIGRQLGFDCVHAEVTLSSIIITCISKDQMKTIVGSVPAVAVNAGKIAALEKISLQKNPPLTAKRINQQLDIIEKTPARYGRWLTTLAAMVGCGVFCFLNNGGWIECLSVALGAGAGQLLRATLAKKRLNQLAVAFLAGLLACGMYLLFSALLMDMLGFSSTRHNAGFTSAVLFLIPGFPLITAALDLARLDFIAGISRLTYALLMIITVSISAWMVANMAHLTPEVAPPLPLDASLLLVLRLGASFLGVFAFASLFNTPFKIALAAAFIGMIANTMRLTMIDFSVPVQLAAPIAALCVGLLAALLSPKIRCPRITLSVPAVLIMIPGTTAYRALVFANNGETVAALNSSFQAMYIVMGIAIGLAAARILTDRYWAIESRAPGI